MVSAKRASISLAEDTGELVLDGVMLLWFLLAAGSLLFVAIDIRTTAASK